MRYVWLILNTLTLLTLSYYIVLIRNRKKNSSRNFEGVNNDQSGEISTFTDSDFENSGNGGDFNKKMILAFTIQLIIFCFPLLLLTTKFYFYKNWAPEGHDIYNGLGIFLIFCISSLRCLSTPFMIFYRFPEIKTGAQVEISRIKEYLSSQFSRILF